MKNQGITGCVDRVTSKTQKTSMASLVVMVWVWKPPHSLCGVMTGLWGRNHRVLPENYISGWGVRAWGTQLRYDKAQNDMRLASNVGLRVTPIIVRCLFLSSEESKH